MKKKERKYYYVHAILYYWGCEERRGPYRWFWVARWVAGSLMVEYPWGMAVITQSPESPPLVKD